MMVIAVTLKCCTLGRLLIYDTTWVIKVSLGYWPGTADQSDMCPVTFYHSIYFYILHSSNFAFFLLSSWIAQLVCVFVSVHQSPAVLTKVISTIYQPFTRWLCKLSPKCLNVIWWFNRNSFNFSPWKGICTWKRIVFFLNLSTLLS